MDGGGSRRVREGLSEEVALKDLKEGRGHFSKESQG